MTPVYARPCLLQENAPGKFSEFGACSASASRAPAGTQCPLVPRIFPPWDLHGQGQGDMIGERRRLPNHANGSVVFFFFFFH